MLSMNRLNNATRTRSSLPAQSVGQLARAYGYLLELAERDPGNVELCQGILTAGLAELDIHVSGGQASGPYVELNEYFQYLLDRPNVTDAEARVYVDQQLDKFRSWVVDFVKRHAPETSERLAPSKPELAEVGS